jgi:hypothetical protein
MITRIVLALALAAVVTISAASAQDARPGAGPVPLEIRREVKPRPVVRPETDRGQAVRDAAAAAAEYEQQQRDDAMVREQTRTIPRRPDLGYDVTSGIQQRNIQRR